MKKYQSEAMRYKEKADERRMRNAKKKENPELKTITGRFNAFIKKIIDKPKYTEFSTEETMEKALHGVREKQFSKESEQNQELQKLLDSFFHEGNDVAGQAVINILQEKHQEINIEKLIQILDTNENLHGENFNKVIFNNIKELLEQDFNTEVLGKKEPEVYDLSEEYAKQAA